MVIDIYSHRLRKSGQALVEGAVALLLIVTVTIGAAYLLLNTGITSFYKEKLGVVTATCALYAAGYSGGDPTASTKTLAASLMKALSIGSRSPTIKVNKTQIAGLTGYIVSISDTFALLGSRFGPFVTLTDQSAATTIPLGNTTVEIRYNQSVSPRLNETIIVPGFRANTPLLPVAAGRLRYLLNKDAGWMPMPEYGLSSPSEAPIN